MSTNFQEIELLMFEITKKTNYLLAEFKTDLTFNEIFNAIILIIKHPDYKNTNDIFVFGNLSSHLAFEDLEEISQMVKKLYPAKATRNKTALVVTSSFGKALAEMWKVMASKLPYEIEIFSELESAVKWVTHK